MSTITKCGVVTDSYDNCSDIMSECLRPKFGPEGSLHFLSDSSLCRSSAIVDRVPLNHRRAVMLYGQIIPARTMWLLT